MNFATQIDIAGLVVFMSASAATSIARLRKALDDAGLNGITLNRRTPYSILHSAAARVFAGGNSHRSHSYAVESLDSQRGVQVTRVVRGTDRVSHDDIIVAYLPDSGGRIRLVDPATGMDDNTYSQAIHDAYVVEQDLLDATGLGAVLAQLVRHYRGLSLRQRGGVYWVSDCHSTEFRSIAAQLEACAEKGGVTDVHCLATVKDRNAIKAVRASLRAETQAALAEYRAQVAAKGGKISATVARNRMQAMDAMDKKLKEYGAELGIFEQDLSDHIAATRRIVTMAKLDALNAKRASSAQRASA